MMYRWSRNGAVWVEPEWCSVGGARMMLYEWSQNGDVWVVFECLY